MQDLQFPTFRVSKSLLDWLLQADEPSVRYHTLVQLLGKDETSREAEDAERQIGRVGWAARILGEQKESTYWDNPETCYVPKYASCILKLIVLADLGVSGEDQRIKNSIEHFFGLHNVETGGFALRPKGSEKFDPHVCTTGNMVRTLAKFGLADDDRVGKAIDWLLSQQLADGGWNCYAVWGGKHGSFKATIEPLWALSELLQNNPRAEWKESAERASEFLLRHRIFRSDRDDTVVMLDFLRTHYPLHYHYDYLHALRVLTTLGTKADPRMNDALKLLSDKRLPDGRWILEGVHRGWRYDHGWHGVSKLAGEVFRPEEVEVIQDGWGSGRTFQLEEAGKPSKWITLQALLVLKRLGNLNLE